MIRITIISRCLFFRFYRILFWNVKKKKTHDLRWSKTWSLQQLFMTHRLPRTLYALYTRCTRGRRLGSTSVVLDSDRKNKDPRAHRDRAVQFSAHECLIFNRIAAMPRLGRGNVLRGKLNSIASCWLTKHEARVRMPSTEIDHH